MPGLYFSGDIAEIEKELRKLLANKGKTLDHRERQICQLRIRELRDLLIASPVTEEVECVLPKDKVSRGDEVLFSGEIGEIELRLRAAIAKSISWTSSPAKASVQTEIATLVDLLKSPLLHQEIGCFTSAPRIWGMLRCQNLSALRSVDGLLVRALRDFETGHSVLHRAAMLANVELISVLVKEKGCDVNSMCLNGQTALHLAVALENVQVAQRLLDLGANAAIEDFNGKTAFCDAPKYIVERFVNKSMDDGFAPRLSEIAAGLEIGECLGKGATACVYAGTYANKRVAVKQFFATNDNRFEFTREASILMKLEHPNIVAFVGVVFDLGWLVTELCSGGSLFDYLHNSVASISPSRVLEICTNTVAALAYLHERTPQVLHLDIKSQNLLFDSNGVVKLADFGVARIVHGASVFSEPCTIAAGTWWWMSPEALFSDNDEIGPKSDIFSFGVCLFEILTREIPYANNSSVAALPPVSVAIQVSNGLRPSSPTLDLNTPLAQLMQRCWANEPQDRPTAVKILDTLGQISR